MVDTRTGVKLQHGQGVSPATLLHDGTLAWIDVHGRLLVRRPGAEAVVLAAGGASALAGARRAIYWTEAGVPRVYRPSSEARSASKPG